MGFNKIIRGANRAANDGKSIYEILDAGFLCHVAYVQEGQPMNMPTVEDICDKFGVIRRTFERRFKKFTGNSVAEYI